MRLSVRVLVLVLAFLLLPMSACTSIDEVAISPPYVGDSFLFERSFPAAPPLDHLVNSTVIGAQTTPRGMVFQWLTESPLSRVTQWVTADWVLMKEETRWKLDYGLAKKNQTWLLEFDAGLKLLESRLSVGKTWTLNSPYVLTVTEPGGEAKRSSGVAELVRKVASREIVHVPVGDFDSFLVEEYQAGEVLSRSWMAFETTYASMSLRLGVFVKSESYSQGKLVSRDELLRYESPTAFDNLRLLGFPAGNVVEWFMAAAITVPVILVVTSLMFIGRKPAHRLQSLTWLSGLISISWGLVLLIASVLGQSWAGSMNNEVLIQAARPMLAFIFDLELEWAPSLLTLGLVLIVLYFTRFKLSVAYLTLTAGLWLTVLGWRTVDFLLHLNEFERFWSLFLSAYIAYRAAGPSLIAAGLAGVLLAMRVASEKGVSQTVGKLDYVVVLSVIVTASVGWLSWFSALEALAAGLISWIVWHFLSIPIATTVIRSRLRRNDVLVRWPEGFSVLDSSAPRIFMRSLLLIALVVNVAPWLVRFLGPPASDPLQYGASLVHYSWYILPTFGLFLGPLKWLMEETGIRRYDSKRQLLEPMRIPSLFQGLVGATAFISVALATYELANEVTTGLTILLLIFVTTLPSALLPTFIYGKLSAPSRSVQLLSRLADEGVLKPSGSVTTQRPEIY